MAHRFTVALPPDEVDRLVRGLVGTVTPRDQALVETLGMRYAGLTIDDLDPEIVRDLDNALALCSRCGVWVRYEDGLHYIEDGEDRQICEPCVAWLDIDDEDP